MLNGLRYVLCYLSQQTRANTHNIDCIPRPSTTFRKSREHTSYDNYARAIVQFLASANNDASQITASCSFAVPCKPAPILNPLDDLFGPPNGRSTRRDALMMERVPAIRKNATASPKSVVKENMTAKLQFITMSTSAKNLCYIAYLETHERISSAAFDEYYKKLPKDEIEPNTPWVAANNPVFREFVAKWISTTLVVPDRWVISGWVFDDIVKEVVDRMVTVVKGKMATGQCDRWKNIAKTSLVSTVMTVENQPYLIETHDVTRDPKTGDVLFKLVLWDIKTRKKKMRRLLLAHSPWLITLPCWAHQINLVGDMFNIRRETTEDINLALEIVKWFNNHGTALELLRQEQLHSFDGKFFALILPALMRWIHHYLALTRITKLKAARIVVFRGTYPVSMFYSLNLSYIHDRPTALSISYASCLTSSTVPISIDQLRSITISITKATSGGGLQSMKESLGTHREISTHGGLYRLGDTLKQETLKQAGMHITQNPLSVLRCRTPSLSCSGDASPIPPTSLPSVRLCGTRCIGIDAWVKIVLWRPSQHRILFHLRLGTRLLAACIKS
ncbi:hypothetical protein BDN70DRAFT_939231 [Pholiota conissans]|uniref:DUF659 domain-containing protein n=1 Tax=Pholiota conissans TaxID=109636 RepID=A0A9P6CRE5_9AGAR|nr:hypothetical protein BDN70DRAFT_939231 [Pholiota conissans]